MAATQAEMERLGHLNQMDFFEWMALGTPGRRTADTPADELAYALPHGFAMMSGVMRATSAPTPTSCSGARSSCSTTRPTASSSSFDPARPTPISSARSATARSATRCAFRRWSAPSRCPVPGLSCAEIRDVGDLEAAADYWSVCAGAYPSLGFPPDVFELFTPEWLIDERIRAFVAYVDGAPVSCALAWISRGVGGLYWVTTLEATRGRGLGAACSVAATNAGFERGARFAALQASPMGESVYQRLGYRELYPYRILFARIEA